MTTPKGLVQIYTGDGKGKTTAALGLGLRAAGHGMNVLMVQFMKTVRYYGELESVKLANVDHSDSSTLRLLENAGFDLNVRQFEMELAL